MEEQLPRAAYKPASFRIESTHLREHPTGSSYLNSNFPTNGSQGARDLVNPVAASCIPEELTSSELASIYRSVLLPRINLCIRSAGCEEPRKNELDDPVEVLLNISKSVAVTPTKGVEEEVSAALLKEVFNLMFGKTVSLKSSELDSWWRSTFVFSEFVEGFTIGLLQQFGGPCGILAPLQCWLVGALILVSMEEKENEEETSKGKKFSILLTASEDLKWTALAWAISTCLFRSTTSHKYILAELRDVLLPSLETKEEIIGHMSNRTKVFKSFFDLFMEVRARLLSESNPLTVLCFVVSVILTRGVQTVIADMDDATLPLIGMFGHSSQELVNLMISGEATTNVFNGNKNLMQGSSEKGEFILKGVQRQQIIGYISELEALSYCEVGDYFKSPVLPVWVVGSPDHFTSIFSFDPRIVAVDESEQIRKVGQHLLTISSPTTQRHSVAFDSIDNESVGIIAATDLMKLLQSCGLSKHFTDARRALDPPGQGGVILKFDFIDWASALMGPRKSSDVPFTEKFVMYHYDGQKNQPRLTRALVELTDVSGICSDVDDLGLGRVLSTKWKNCLVSII